MQLARPRDELCPTLARQNALDVFPPDFPDLRIRVFPDQLHELTNTDELEVEPKLAVALDTTLRGRDAICLLECSLRRPRRKRDDPFFADAALPTFPISHGAPLKQQLR